MAPQNEINLRVADAIARLESRGETLSETVDQHDKSISSLEKSVSAVVSEIKQIRNAIYLMAGMLALNISDEKAGKLWALLSKVLFP